MRHLQLGLCVQMPASERAPGETPSKGSTAHLQDGTLAFQPHQHVVVALASKEQVDA